MKSETFMYLRVKSQKKNYYEKKIENNQNREKRVLFIEIIHSLELNFVLHLILFCMHLKRSVYIYIFSI